MLEETIVAAVAQLAGADNFATQARMLAQRIEPVLRTLDIDGRIDVLDRTEAGFPRICLAVLLLEVTKVARDPNLEIFTLFVLSNQIGGGPLTSADFRAFADAQTIYSAAFLEGWRERSWADFPQAIALLERHRTEYLKLAHDQLLDYLGVYRDVALRMALVLRPVAGEIGENDRRYAFSRAEVATQSPELVEAVDRVSTSLWTSIQGMQRRSEGLRRYLQMQSLTEAEALGITTAADEGLFEARFSAALAGRGTRDAWDLLQSFRSTVLLSQLVEHRAGATEGRESFKQVRAWGRRFQELGNATDPFQRFRARVELDRQLWNEHWDQLPGMVPAAFQEPESALANHPLGALHQTEIALIEYVVTDTETFALILRPGGSEPRSVRIPLGRVEIARLARDLLFGHSAFRPGRFEAGWRIDPRAPVPELQQLAALVAWIPEVIEEGAHLCFVPYGVLHGLPFHALTLSDTAGAPFVIERHVVSYLPCSSLLPLVRGAGGAPRSARGLVAGAMYRGQDQASLDVHLQDIVSLLEPGASVLLSGAEATPAAILASAAREAHNLVYIFGHGKFVPGDSTESHVALADGQVLPTASEPPPYARLRAADLMASGARGELIVIAACVSGRSEVRPGDELLGFTRALLFRGFDTLVTALWSFEVRSGRRLLECFLRGWLREGLGRAEALAAAQRAFLRGELGERWRHPYFWGSFFLVGQWD